MGCTPSKEQREGVLECASSPSSMPFSLNPRVALHNLLAAAPDVKTLKKVGRGGAHHLANIFAKPLEAFDAATYRPPHHSKLGSEEVFIRQALAKNFVFEDLDEIQLKPLVGAFEKKTVEACDIIIKQGDEGDYFYVLHEGKCDYVVGSNVVGKAQAGDTFGELALMYTCPRAATVVATTNVTLFRVDQKSFRYILQAQTKQGSEAKTQLLRKVQFLQDLSPHVISKLANAMQARPFVKDEVVVKKGGDEVAFYVIEKGELVVTDLGEGEMKYEDVDLVPGEHFGERGIVTGRPPVGNVIGKTDGHLFTIDKETFQEVIGDLDTAVLRSVDKKCLEGIKVMKDSHLDSTTLASLARLIKDTDFDAGDMIMDVGRKTEAALYILRSGKIQQTIAKSGKRTTLETGGYFGDQLLLHDSEQGKNSPRDSTQVEAPYSVNVLESCRVGILYLKDCRTLFDTTALGQGKKAATFDSLKEENLSLESFERHTVLGAGTFGQVWLVSRDSPKGKQAYALKIQAKYELVSQGQAKAVLKEKEIMAQLNHPLLGSLAGSFKDDDFLYMVMGLIQGGELYSVMHTNSSDGIPEKAAQFYVAGIAEALGYMHRRGFVYRDLKPENVLISNEGYPVIVDFGFAKYVSDMTYTLCGTPLYIPPEVILNRGHNWGCDHWSLGVMFYEMVDGDTPFYEHGMDQVQLFRAIVKGKYRELRNLSSEGKSLMDGFLQRDYLKRLGGLAGGEDDIPAHPFFAELDFGKIRNKEYPAPYVPNVQDPLDSSKFEMWDHLDDKLSVRYPKLDDKEERIFDNF